MASPVFEFPYSGYKSSAIPFLNYNPSGLTPYNVSSLDSLFHDRSSTFTVPDSRQLFQDLGNNTVVYKIPDHMSLDTLLRQLGVDVDHLKRASSYNGYYSNASLPFERRSSSFPRGRRRRLECREVSDSEDDDPSRDSSPHHRRHRHRHSSNSEYNQSPTRVHNLLNNAWTKAAGVPRNLPQQTSGSNINLQGQGMQSGLSSISPEHRDAVSNVWTQATNASTSKPNFLSSFFKKMKPGNTNTDTQSQGPQQNNSAAQNYASANNFFGGGNQPNNAAANVFNAAQQGAPSNQNLAWNRMSGASPPQQTSYPPGPQMNSMWNQMSGARPAPPQQTSYPPGPQMNSMWSQMSGARPPPPQQPMYPPGPPMNSMWNQMSGASPQQPSYPPGPPMNSMWNQMSGASPQQPSYPPGPPMNSMWNQMSGASPQQPSYPPGPPMNSMWNQMSGARPPPPQQPMYPPGPQQGYYPSAPPQSVTALVRPIRT
ncbi:hypothetical protein I4U23_024125 [Adineta vaga]|nr:hypothetical protein I4U23_024125 [Adineta vaga]